MAVGKRLVSANAVLVFAVVMAGILVRFAFASTKTDFHLDEGYSVAITAGDWMPGQDAVAHNRWLSRDEVWGTVFLGSPSGPGKADFSTISAATGRDVHPPLYYWAFGAFRALMGPGNFARSGYALNLFLFAITCALLSAIVWRLRRNWIDVSLTLALFVFSSTAISLTVFIRMYELLQTVCVAFLACALFVLFPVKGRHGTVATMLAIAGLCATSFAGLLTHYYFLFFLISVAAFSAMYLVSRLRLSALLWCILAVAIGLYLAYRTFPQMESHLVESYRARQSVNALGRSFGISSVSRLVAFAAMIAESLIPLAALLAAIALAVATRSRESHALEARARRLAARSPLAVPSLVLFLFVFAATFFPIALSAPYRSARYIGAFFPVYALAFASFAFLALPRHTARALLGATVLLVAIHGVRPSSFCAFHEDYSIEGSTGFMRDDKPLILLSTGEGVGWKNMLVYVNMGLGKRIYVANDSAASDVTARLKRLARESGGTVAYALVENLFSTPPALERIGYYGFFSVYRIPVE